MTGSTYIEDYNQAKLIVGGFTPMLWTPSISHEDSVESGGSSVLYKFGGHFLLLTAGHCLKDFRTGHEIEVGVLHGAQYKKMQGEAVIVRGDQNQLDVGIMRLDEPSKVHCEKGYRFFEDSQPFTNWNNPAENNYMLVGYPASKVNIDHKKKRATVDPLVYLIESTEIFDYEKYHFRKEQHLMLKYDQRRSGIIGSRTISMAPDPTGTSGSGVWLIQRHPDKDAITLKLAGLIVEQLKKLGLLAAMKMDLVHWVLGEFLQGKAPFQDLFRV